MIKALFCIFSVVIGIYALFLGVQTVADFNWRIESTEVKYTDPPFINKKEATMNSFGSDLKFETETKEIICYTYEDFLTEVEKYRKERELTIEVKETNSIREGIVTSASASSEGIRISYEPSLLIILNGYGSEELILEMEKESDERFLRLVLPNTEYSRTVSRVFRQMQLPYALNSYGIGEGDMRKAMQDSYYPRYSIEISRLSATFSNQLTAEELQLKMKGIIYVYVINSYEKGWEMVVFEATIKNLKALQAVLDEMMPLPVRLVPYPFWRDN